MTLAENKRSAVCSVSGIDPESLTWRMLGEAQQAELFGIQWDDGYHTQSATNTGQYYY